MQVARTGVASVVDVSLLGAAVWTLGVDLVATAACGVEPKPPRPALRSAAPCSSAPSAPATIAGCCLNMIDHERHWEPTCRALGLEQLLDEPGYATTEARTERVRELHDLFVAAIGSQLLDDLKARLAAEDTIWSTMSSPNEVIADPQVEANGYMPRVPDHPTARLSSAPMQFDGTGLEIRRRAPEIGEHTDEVLREIGVDRAEIDRLHAAGAIV